MIEDRDDPRVLEIALKRPAKFYKYTALDGLRKEWTRNILVDSALFFAPPSKFNDPLDCRIPPSFEAEAKNIERFWREKWKSRGQQPRSQEELDRLSAMSGTEESRQKLTNAYYELLDTYGIACFNERPDNFLLWSYYAESHKGVAVRFDTGTEILKQIPEPYFLLKVEYAKDFPKISIYEPDRFTLVQTTLATKAEAWTHEEEWRLIAVGRSGIIHMPNKMIDGVVFGLRTPPEVEREVRGWVTEAGRDIELMRVQHRANSFALEVVAV
jgi:hypothetical protein